MAVSNVGTRMYYPFNNGPTLKDDLSCNGYTLTATTPVPIPSGVVDGRFCIGPFASGCSYNRNITAGIFPETLPNLTISFDFYAYDIDIPRIYPFLMKDTTLLRIVAIQFDPARAITVQSSSPAKTVDGVFQLNRWYNLLISIQTSGATNVYLDNNLIKTFTNNHGYDYIPRRYYIGATDSAAQNMQFSGCIANFKLLDYIVESNYTQSNIVGGL